jgi:hypothetical protein
MEYTREDLAKDALIAAALRAVEFKKEVSENDILLYSTNSPELSAEDKTSLASLGTDLFAKSSKSTRTQPAKAPTINNVTLEESIMAMNRKNADDNISEETKEEIERKRVELRKKLANERKKKEDGRANSGTC